MVLSRGLKDNLFAAALPQRAGHCGESVTPGPDGGRAVAAGTDFRDRRFIPPRRE